MDRRKAGVKVRARSDRFIKPQLHWRLEWVTASCPKANPPKSGFTAKLRLQSQRETPRHLSASPHCDSACFRVDDPTLTEQTLTHSTNWRQANISGYMLATPVDNKAASDRRKTREHSPQSPRRLPAASHCYIQPETSNLFPNSCEVDCEFGLFKVSF